MKRKISFSAVVMLTAALLLNFGVEESQHGSPEKTLKKIFTLVKSGNFNEAINYVALSKGSEGAAEWFGVNSNNKAEVKTAKRLLRRISKYFRLSDKYEFGKIKNTGGTSVIPVKFISKGRSIEVEFELTKVKTSYFLIDID